MDPRIKSFEPTWKAAAEGSLPSPTDLALINRFALEPLTAEQVYVRTMRLCNDKYDRSGERFPLGYLNRFRDTLPGKSLLPVHDKKSLPLGLFFKADVEQDGAVQHVVTSFYMVRSAGNEELRAQIDAGVVGHVSIGFRWSDLICDICQRSYYQASRDENGELRWCAHLIGRLYNGVECTATYGGDLRKVEAVEGSLVYLGCQYESEIVKSALWGGEEDAERVPDPAAEKELIRRKYFARNEPEEAMSEKTETAPPAAEEEKGSGSAAALAARVAELEAAIAEVEPLVADGRLYRKDLAAEISRLAGAIEAAKEAELVLRACKDADCIELKAVCAEYQGRFDAKFPPQGKGSPAQPEAEAEPKAERQRHRFRLF
jgi:hypothetical protein